MKGCVGDKLEDWALARPLHLAEAEPIHSGVVGICREYGRERRSVRESANLPLWSRRTPGSELLNQPRCAGAGEFADADDGLRRKGGLVGVLGLVPGERCPYPARLCPG